MVCCEHTANVAPGSCAFGPVRWCQALALLALAACDRPGEMRGCRKHWDALVRSSNESEEAILAERFAECADNRGLRYGLTLKNRKTGATVSFVDYEQMPDPIVLTISVGSKRETAFTWVPRRNANIVELMGE
jgi:hypothetical protein